MRHDDHDDPVLTALRDLLEAADAVEASLAAVRARAEHLLAMRERGVPYRDLVDETHRPLIAELLTDTISRFEAAGTRFRAAEARALRAEGLTLERIGELFGLTRQRISALLAGTRQ